MNVKELKQCNSSVKLGCYGEKAVKRLLGGKIRFHAGHDIDHAALGRLEVKTSYLGSDNRYQFCLRKNDKHGKTDVGHADYLVLVCLSISGDKIYVIPSQSVPTTKKLSLSKNSVRFSEFRIL